MVLLYENNNNLKIITIIMQSGNFQKELTIRYCLECGSEIKQGCFLPLYNYENQFCELCEIGDYEGKCYCSES